MEINHMDHIVTETATTIKASISIILIPITPIIIIIIIETIGIQCVSVHQPRPKTAPTLPTHSRLVELARRKALIKRSHSTTIAQAKCPVAINRNSTTSRAIENDSQHKKFLINFQLCIKINDLERKNT